MTELKPYSVMRKENSERPGVWTAASMPQNPLLAPPPAPSSGSTKLEICVDDEFQDDDPLPTSRPGAAGSEDPLLRPRELPVPLAAPIPHPPIGNSVFLSSTVLSMPPLALGPKVVAGGSLAPGIGFTLATTSAASGILPRSDPAALDHPSHKPSCDPPRSSPAVNQGQDAASGSGAHRAAHVPPAASVGYDVALLVDNLGAEQSFEEARAASWRAKAISKPPDQPLATADVSGRSVSASQAAKGSSNKTLATSQDTSRPVAADSGLVDLEGTSTENNSKPRGISSRTEARPTMMTLPMASREAIPLRGSHCASLNASASIPSSSLPFHEPDVTMSTLAAFDALNDMFSDDACGGKGTSLPSSRTLPDKAMAQPLGAKRAQALVSAPPVTSSAAQYHEPTVTFSTKEAFDALNDMFSDGLPHEHGREKQRKVRGWK